MLPRALRKLLTPIARPLARAAGLRVYDYDINDFYWAVPDQDRIGQGVLNAVSELPGLRMNEPQQIELLRRLVERYKSEYQSLPAQRPADPDAFFWQNGSFGNHDAILLYCLIRELRPRKIIEIGAGASTRLTATALRKNRPDSPCHFTTIDPYPDAVVAAGFDGLDKLIRSPVQQVPMDTFTALEAGDILFIDSSHVLHVGSDVHYEFLEVLPRIAAGVYVHVHDIFMPQEYPAWAVRNGRFWDEQYLLQAFLAFNDSFEIVWAGNYMNHRNPGEMTRALAGYDAKKNQPGSFWMKRVK